MKRIKIFSLLVLSLAFFSFHYQKEELISLKVQINGLRNSNGTVHVALYIDSQSFPDENFEKFYRKEILKLGSGSSSVSFENLPPGTYVVSIFHDENDDGKFNKLFKLPKEGIGFSNYESVNVFNKPVFKKAALELNSDENIVIKMIYL